MFAFLVAALLQPQRAETDAACVKCHENQLDDWKGSAHEKASVGCVTCHGADSVDTAKSRPHANLAGFRRGTKKTNAALCAECHMEEFTAFGKSDHAEETRDDSSKVKGCISCHEPHGTAVAERRAILKENCAKCHRPGSVAMKLGEKYAAFADGLRLGGPALQHARVAQHEASAAAYARIAAYNTGNAGSAWPYALAVVAALGAVLAWVLRGTGRASS